MASTLVDEHLNRGLHTLTSFRQQQTEPATDQQAEARRSHGSTTGHDTITVVAPARQTSDWRWFLAYTTVTWLPTTAWVLLLLRKVSMNDLWQRPSIHPSSRRIIIR